MSSEKINLEDIGWNDFFKKNFALYKGNSKASKDASHNTNSLQASHDINSKSLRDSHDKNSQIS